MHGFSVVLSWLFSAFLFIIFLGIFPHVSAVPLLLCLLLVLPIFPLQRVVKEKLFLSGHIKGVACVILFLAAFCLSPDTSVRAARQKQMQDAAVGALSNVLSVSAPSTAASTTTAPPKATTTTKATTAVTTAATTKATTKATTAVTTAATTKATTAVTTAATTKATTTAPAADPDGQVNTYVLNTNTKKFHKPDCKSVKKMKEKNKGSFTGTRDAVIAQGYDPCGNCHP